MTQRKVRKSTARVLAAVATAALSAVGAGVVTSAPAAATTTRGSTLTACHSLSNPHGTYSTEVLVANDTQGDRYDVSIGTGAVLLNQAVSFSTPGARGATYGTNWYASGSTRGTGSTKLALYCNGDLALIGPSGTRLWHSNTAGKGGKRLTLTTGGNLVIYTAKNKAVWSSRTGRDMLVSGHSLWAGQTLVGAVRQYSPRNTLTMQPNGNLVYQCNGVVRWQTHTGTARSHARITPHGLLQVVSPAGHVLWTTSRQGWGGFLSMYDGELYSGGSNGGFLWHVPNFYG